ncbi:MAG: hypothetical protein ACK5NK_11520 [Niabella sp.]
MNRIFTFVLTILLAATPCFLFVTCSKQTSNNTEEIYDLAANKVMVSNATIVGADMRECVCCGGYFISIPNYKPIAGEYFLTYDFPNGYVPKTYPLKVQIEWAKDPNACVNDKIIIKKITIIQTQDN